MFSGLNYKCVAVVIYERSHSGLYCKCHKWCLLQSSLTIVIYNCYTFIAQATDVARHHSNWNFLLAILKPPSVICISVFLSLCLFVHLSVYLNVHPSVFMSTPPSIYPYACLSNYPFIVSSAFQSNNPSVSLSVYLSVCMPNCLSVCLSLCLSVWV